MGRCKGCVGGLCGRAARWGVSGKAVWKACVGGWGLASRGAWHGLLGRRVRSCACATQSSAHSECKLSTCHKLHQNSNLGWRARRRRTGCIPLCASHAAVHSYTQLVTHVHTHVCPTGVVLYLPQMMSKFPPLLMQWSSEELGAGKAMKAEKAIRYAAHPGLLLGPRKADTGTTLRWWGRPPAPKTGGRRHTAAVNAAGPGRPATTLIGGPGHHPGA